MLATASRSTPLCSVASPPRVAAEDHDLRRRKASDGTVSGIEVSDLGPGAGSEIAIFAGAHSGLLDDDDIDEAGSTMEPDTIGVLLVYENLWAVPIVAAAHAQGGGLIAGTMISAQNVVDRLAALESAD